VWVEFVGVSSPCSTGISLVSPVFFSPQKPTFLNRQFDLEIKPIIGEWLVGRRAR